MTGSAMARKVLRLFTPRVRGTGSMRVADPSSRSRPRLGGVAAVLGASRLPADAPAQLRRLALLLALIQRRLEDRQDDHEHREEADHAEREERDQLVVGLADEPLTVVTGEGGRGRREPERKRERRRPKPHGASTIPCRAEWPT